MKGEMLKSGSRKKSLTGNGAGIIGAANAIDCC